MGIDITFIHVKKNLEFKPIIKILLEGLIKQEGKELGEITLIFTSNSHILEINRTYLNHHYFTDVITFPENKKNRIAGDIFISLDQVLLNSERYKTDYYDEVTRVMIHGILHLIGYQDITSEQKKVMSKIEDHYLCGFKKFDYLV